MGSVKDELLYAADDAARAAWEQTLEGRRWLAEQDSIRQEAAHTKSERERRWMANHPVEWAAWVRVQTVWNPEIDLASIDSPFDFDAFLNDVGRAPTQNSRIVRKDDLLPFRPGNLRWDEPRRKSDTPNVEPEYLDLRAVADMTNMSYDFVREAAVAGRLTACKKGGQWRVKPADARAWMEKDRGPQSTPPAGVMKDKVRRYLPGLHR